MTKPPPTLLEIAAAKITLVGIIEGVKENMVAALDKLIASVEEGTMTPDQMVELQRHLAAVAAMPKLALGADQMRKG